WLAAHPIKPFGVACAARVGIVRRLLQPTSSMATTTSATGPTAVPQELHVQAQLIAILFARGRGAVTINVIVSVLSAAFLWRTVPWEPLAAWFVLLCSVNAG